MHPGCTVLSADEAGDENRGVAELTRTESSSNGGRGDSSSAKATEDEGSSAVELTDEEKLVMKLLAEKSPVDLNELKGQTGLSNKKWDTAIKGLRKHNLAKVEKNDEGLFVELV